MKKFLFLFITTFLLSTSLHAKRLTLETTPEPLKPWVDWVLEKERTFNCSQLYNSKSHVCAWASRLNLNLNEKGGNFSQSWQIEKATWLRLAGNKKSWPLDVKINKEAVIVSHYKGFPAVYLPQGNYQVTGNFKWDRLPESLVIPIKTGLVSLTLNNKKVDFPKINNKGQLWLEQTKQKKTIQDSLDLQVFRHIIDGQPMRVETRIELNVAGRSREIQLSPILLDGFIPFEITSTLPARINEKGILRVQIRPGRWYINLTARGIGQINQLIMPKTKKPLPQHEVWVFQAKSSLRLVEIEGIKSIDPRQTSLPKHWQQFPAYQMDPEQPFKLKILQRGSAEPEPNRLTLKRNMWLDFDGQGYTFRDNITGTMTKGWRLQTTEQLELGSVSIDNKPQFITRLNENTTSGVEVRRGKINLSADSRYEKDIKNPPVTGWLEKFQQVNTTLYLPAGWSLLFAQGMDNIPNTWVGRWSLLDLFLVLISAIAIARLWGFHWGLFSLITLALIWHEPNAPKMIWLNLIAVIALLRLIPKSAFQRLLKNYRNLSFIALILIILPFAIQEIRLGLYPQLSNDLYYNENTSAATTKITNNYGDGIMLDSIAEEASPAAPRRYGNLASVNSFIGQEEKRVNYYSQKKSKQWNRNVLTQIDPNANIQTGPGRPAWKTKATYFSWQGSVDSQQKITFFYLCPLTNMMIKFLSILLLFILIWRLISPIIKIKKPSAKTTAILCLLCLMPLLILPSSQVIADEFPNQKLLNELKKRLTKAPQCLPYCAQIERMKLVIKADTLQIRLKLHAATKTVIPLPGGLKYWQPSEILVNNNAVQRIKHDKKGVLWIGVESGIHDIILRGKLAQRQQIHLPLPLKPHYVDWTSEGWKIEGIRDNHIPEQQLQLVRKKSSTTPKGVKKLTDESSILPPLLRISRTLHLGLEWTLDTKVTRLSPLGTPINATIPLLADESVLSSRYQVKDGFLKTSFSSRQRQIEWQSQLKIKPQIKLTALNLTDFVEQWQLDTSPNWHVEISGIPTIHQNQDNRAWLPKWKPWAGETVTLDITKPQGIKGQTLTIDSTKRVIEVGKRGIKTTLHLNIRSSQGGQHPIILPQNSELLVVKINHKSQPIRQQNRTLNLPLTPGQQNIEIQWRETTPIKTKLIASTVHIGSHNVNQQTQIKMGADRWILFAGGPTQGPAILFWGVLIVLFIGAIILGILKLAPLNILQWFLLSLGLCLASPMMVLIIVGWLLAMGQRPKLARISNNGAFNGGQMLLGLFTLVAFMTLLMALQKGLLGYPDMQIAGNGSTAWHLKWFQDRSNDWLAQPWVISVPLFAYRLLMLFWALWLAFSLLNWLKWGWTNFTIGGLWRTKEKLPEELID